ncbi:Myoneurin [Eumeta japonica]|uniref:Myoneurin n=1 Tax=Eumeta variegata TaxID=151549 RepID=A0A4C1V2I2_EUMVA|nr:Myoneurin [Eumeta japonica]
MESHITVEPLPLEGLCNLCLRVGYAKSMFSEYNFNGTIEIYADMLAKSFSIDISDNRLGETKRLICDNCCNKLRNVMKFREQVESALQTLEETVRKVKEENDCKEEQLGEGDNTDDACVKEENYKSSEDDLYDGDEDLKIVPLTNYLSDSENTDSDKKKLKASHNILEGIAEYMKRERPDCNSAENERGDHRRRKENQMIKPLYPDRCEIEKLLNNGLFPFKMTKTVFACTICSQRFKSLNETKNHVMQHKSKSVSSAFRKMYLSNRSIFDIVDAKFRCKLCKGEVQDYDGLESHIRGCNLRTFKEQQLPFKLDKNQVDCPICEKHFLNYMSLNVHMNIHYPNYVCELCGKAFASKLRLKGHMRTHEIGEFPCKYCDMVFDKATKRENHVSKEHKSGIRYACKRCNISLSSFYARQKHLAEVHNEELKRYKCKACTQSYITPGHLSSHVRRDHLNERNHKCDKCDQAFYTSNALKMHMIKHDGERIHTCQVCNKAYQRLKTLKEHMRIHNNDKRFVCTVCGKAFTQKCTLKGHLKVHERKTDEPIKLEIRHFSLKASHTPTASKLLTLQMHSGFRVTVYSAFSYSAIEAIEKNINRSPTKRLNEAWL